MIKFSNVVKKFPGSAPAVDDVTVEIKDGDFVFLIGPSGAGKTTLLRLLLGDILPTQGEVFLNDICINKYPRKKIYILRRKIGMVFQDNKLLFDRTVFENVSIALEIVLKKNPVQIANDVQDVLRLVDLTEQINRFPLELSAGELQRASIARAIVGGPKVLLADEPTGNLDPQTAEEVLKVFEEINKMGTTIIMATHNREIVNHLKKRTIVMERGKIISDTEKGSYQLKTKTKDKKS